MITLNVSFGIFAFLPQGWIFMTFVILLEGFLLSRLFLEKSFDASMGGIALLSNMISGIVGFGASIVLNGGWWLVIWLPWVSDNEVDISNRDSLQTIVIYYACAFVLTVLIECLVNWLMLRKTQPAKQIITTTLIANCVSYAIGTLVLYTYSFS